MNADDTELVVGRTSSGAERLARKARRARVVWAFGTVPSEVLFAVFEGRQRSPRPSLVYMGEDDDAKAVAATLIRDMGFEPVDAGPLRMARYTESFALLVAQLAYEGEGGPEMTYRSSGGKAIEPFRRPALTIRLVVPPSPEGPPMRPSAFHPTVTLMSFALWTSSCTEPAPVSVSSSGDSSLPAATVAPAASLACDAANGGIVLPAGFCAIVVADQVGLARHVTVRPNGDVYVALRRKPDGSDNGGILALRDTDGDGKANRVERFGTLGGTGIAWYQGALYFAADDRVLRYTISGTNLLPSSAPVTIVSGLPAAAEHKAKNITFGSSYMYVNIASGSNSCQVQNRTLESPGQDPCPELATRAGVWRFNPGRTGQRQSDGLRFATGLRDMLALAVKPGTGALYGVQHDRDLLGKNWPGVFTMAQDATIPSEEFVRIRQGDDYGWPYCHHDRLQNKKVLAPEYGGDGKVVGRCSTKKLPLMTFPAHWAPMSMVFYTKQQFPAKYAGGTFVAFHGDNFTDTRPRTDNPGYHVAFVPFVNGAPTGYEIFASGFVGSGTATPTGARHRATGLAQGPDGSLYITDDKGGRIWRVIYRGS